MDSLTEAYYQQRFLVSFLEKTGMEFQGFFADVMSKCYPGDFIPTRPWGRRGDRKNDGYLCSERILFQVYAPEELKDAKAIEKIDEDLFGAIPHWKEHFDTWCFVHNARPRLGLPAPIEQKLLDLESSGLNFRVRPWGFEELRQRAFGKLRESDLAVLLGPAPSRAEFLNVQIPELRVIVDAIALALPSDDPDVQPVDKDKLTANALSPWVRKLLETGMWGCKPVKEFFDRYHDPLLGGRVANAFKAEYLLLRARSLVPDAIYTELQMFIGGNAPQPPQRQVAGNALLAFLFEECHIFEPARSNPSP